MISYEHNGSFTNETPQYKNEQTLISSNKRLDSKNKSIKQLKYVNVQSSLDSSLK
jgi:hypothetical protein